MILARLTAAIRAQNWFAVALEFVIVIAGVVIGFQITAWNAERTTSTQELAHLRALRADLVQSIASAEGYIGFSELSIESVMALLRAADPETESMDVASFDSHILNGVFRYFSLDANMSTLEELQSSGELSALRDADTRLALVQVLFAMEDMRSTEEDFIHISRTFSDPWLVQTYDLRRIQRFDPAARSLPLIQGVEPVRDQDPRILIHDPVLQNLLSLRSIVQANVLRTAQRLLASYQVALERIDDRINTLEGSP